MPNIDRYDSHKNTNYLQPAEPALINARGAYDDC